MIIMRIWSKQKLIIQLLSRQRYIEKLHGSLVPSHVIVNLILGPEVYIFYFLLHDFVGRKEYLYVSV